MMVMGGNRLRIPQDWGRRASPDLYRGVRCDLNCHRARQLISPYLDDQLTGRQMLSLRQHFSECPSCEAEHRSISQVKRLLRSLHQPQPPAQFPQAIAVQVEHRGSLIAHWIEFGADVCRHWLLSPTRPQRGRRLATSLALSCLTVLAVAAPFAPASKEQTLNASGLFLPVGMTAEAPAQPGMLALTAVFPDARLAETMTLADTDEARRERLFAAQYAQPAPPALAAAPGGDDAVNSYVQGDVALAGYRTR